MIKDKLSNAECYFAISERLKKGFEWLISSNLEALEDGKYLIDGENIFANVQSYITKDDAPYETHKKYIDIQYMIKGVEKVGVAEKKDCMIMENYSEAKDVTFLECNKNNSVQILKEGEFLVFFPQDAHQPALKLDKNNPVKKVIVKVAV